MKYSARIGNNKGRKFSSFYEMESEVQKEVGEAVIFDLFMVRNGNEYGTIIKESDGLSCGAWIKENYDD